MSYGQNAETIVLPDFLNGVEWRLGSENYDYIKNKEDFIVFTEYYKKPCSKKADFIRIGIDSFLYQEYFIDANLKMKGFVNLTRKLAFEKNITLVDIDGTPFARKTYVYEKLCKIGLWEEYNALSDFAVGHYENGLRVGEWNDYVHIEGQELLLSKKRFDVGNCIDSISFNKLFKLPEQSIKDSICTQWFILSIESKLKRLILTKEFSLIETTDIIDIFDNGTIKSNPNEKEFGKVVKAMLNNRWLLENDKLILRSKNGLVNKYNMVLIDNYLILDKVD